MKSENAYNAPFAVRRKESNIKKRGSDAIRRVERNLKWDPVKVQRRIFRAKKKGVSPSARVSKKEVKKI